MLGLIFLKHISEGFMARRAELEADYPEGVEDEYRADNVFRVPKPARWPYLQANAKQPNIGKHIDEAMLEIEKVNASLKGVLPRGYARPALNPVMLGELINLISVSGFKSDEGPSRDVLGRVYEYFLAEFAGANCLIVTGQEALRNGGARIDMQRQKTSQRYDVLVLFLSEEALP